MQILARSRHGVFEATILLQWVGIAIESPVYFGGKHRWKMVYYPQSKNLRNFAPSTFAGEQDWDMSKSEISIFGD